MDVELSMVGSAKCPREKGQREGSIGRRRRSKFAAQYSGVERSGAYGVRETTRDGQ
jgi:hypothetical protein